MRSSRIREILAQSIFDMSASNELKQEESGGATSPDLERQQAFGESGKTQRSGRNSPVTDQSEHLQENEGTQDSGNIFVRTTRSGRTYVAKPTTETLESKVR